MSCFIDDLEVQALDILNYGGEEAVLNSYIWDCLQNAKIGVGHHERKIINGNLWVRLPVYEIQEIFKFWSRPKIYRMLKKLESMGAIEVKRLGKNGVDDCPMIRDNWYSIKGVI